MNHPRDDFLAGPGLAEDEHRDVGLRGGADPLEDDQHLLVAPDHSAEALDGRRLVFGADVSATLEELVEQAANGFAAGPDGRELRRRFGTCRTMPNSTSSRRQFSTSRRMRPNVAINASTRLPGRALRKRSRPARRGDWTRHGIVLDVAQRLDSRPQHGWWPRLLSPRAPTRFRRLDCLSADLPLSTAPHTVPAMVMLLTELMPHRSPGAPDKTPFQSPERQADTVLPSARKRPDAAG